MVVFPSWGVARVGRANGIGQDILKHRAEASKRFEAEVPFHDRAGPEHHDGRNAVDGAPSHGFRILVGVDLKNSDAMTVRLGEAGDARGQQPAGFAPWGSKLDERQLTAQDFDLEILIRDLSWEHRGPPKPPPR
jgi:hypothetical protein